MTVRRALTILCLVAIVVPRVKTRLLILPFIDRTPIERTMLAFPDGTWLQYPRFLNEVRSRTNDVVATGNLPAKRPRRRSREPDFR